jgi:hypothetical protein
MGFSASVVDAFALNKHNVNFSEGDGFVISNAMIFPAQNAGVPNEKRLPVAAFRGSVAQRAK